MLNTMLLMELTVLDIAGSLTFFVLLIIIIMGILRGSISKIINMRLIIFIFAYFFHYLSPVIQISYGRYPNYLPIENNYIYKANLILIIFYIVILLLPSFDASKIQSNLFVSKNIPFKLIIGINMLNIVLTLFIFKNFGRGYYLGEVYFSSVYNSTFSLLLTSIISGVSVSNFLYTSLYVYTRRNMRNFFLLILSFVLFIMHVNFLVSSRYYIAFVLILFLFIYLRNKVSTNNFILLLFIGIIIIFPLLNFFRDGIDGVNFFSVESVLKSMEKQYIELHFDSYSQVISGIKYIEDNGYLFGASTFSSILFFIPRKFFPFKTDGLGAILGKYLAETTIYGQILGDFSNVSASFITEIFVNFSYLGLITIPVFVYYLIKKTVYESSPIYMGIFLGFSFFIMRGDLMSSLAYFIGALTIIYYIPNLFIKNKKD